MDSAAEIKMLELLHVNAEERANLWESLAKAEVTHHTRTKEMVWNIMGRGVKRENNYGDCTEIVLDINDWRELCEAVNFGK
jgi:hypothetical protein